MKETVRIAALIPSRGLVFSETMRTLFNNLRGMSFELIFVTGLPIPDAQNEMVRKAMETDCTHFWLLEEDMEMPDGTLYSMLEMDEDVVCVDYPVAGGWSTIKSAGSEIKHCGLGCTLVKRKVFEVLKEPWFSIDKSLDARTGEILDIPMKYGGHDIFFGISLRENGFEIKQLEGVECGHYRCSDLNRREFNNAVYEIYKLDPVTKKQDLKGGE